MVARKRRTGRQGFTLLEMMTVLAIVGITAAMAIPRITEMQASGRLRGQARDVANLMQLARQRAIATGNNHVVYLASSVGSQDLCTNAVPVDPTTGVATPVLLIDDGAPGGNCCIDANEVIESLPAQQGVRWGVRAGLPQVPQDGGTGNRP